MNDITRPSWDQYYLTLTYVIAQRSFDPSTKCGCIIVSKENKVLSTGYNGPIKGSIDSEIPLTRPEKYCHMIHAEENALLAYNGSLQDIIGSTAYVTGRPCHRCLRDLIQKGITTIIYGDNMAVMMDKAETDAEEIMLRHRSIKMVYIPNQELVFDLLDKTKQYIIEKQKR